MVWLNWRLSLRTKIIAWSFVPTAITLVAVALVTLYAYQQVTEDLVIGRNRELNRLMASQLATEMAEYAGLLTSISHTPEITSADMASRQVGLQKLRNRLVVFDAGVVILDSQGMLVASDPNRPDATGQDWSNRSYFRQMLRGGTPTFSEVVADGPGGAEVIVVAVPIRGSRSEFQGVLAGMFRLGATSVSAFYGGIVKLRMGEHSNAYLVDPNGRVIYHSDTGRIGSEFSSQALLQQAASGRVDSMRTFDFAGQEVVASYASVPGTSWALVSQESWPALIGSSQGYGRLLLLLLGMGVVVPALVVTFGVRLITRPISELIGAAQGVAGGNFGQMIEVPTGDELEKLAEQFNLMSSELKESYTTLEHRVEERTRELQEANRQLEREIAQRRLAEEALRASEAEYHDLVENANSIILQMDPQGRVTFFNRFAQDFFGFTPEEIVGRNVVGTIVPPVDQGGINLEERMADIMNHPERYYTNENENMRANGERVWVAWTNRAVYDKEGKLVEILCIGMDQTEHKRAEEMQAQQAQERAVAAERTRLARDLHDAVTQTLFSASLIAEVLPRLWDRKPDEARLRLEELRQLTRGALAEMRTLLLELRPAALVETWLGDLLRQLAEATTGRARVPVSLVTEGQCSLPPDVQVTLYRIAQESLNNVAKHSEATAAKLTLRCRPDRVELWIVDDGKGFDPSRVTGDHLGLNIMRERAEAVGADLCIESRPGQGTIVSAIWIDPSMR